MSCFASHIDFVHSKEFEQAQLFFIHSSMKVILMQDIAKTGLKGQVVEVSEGFGRHLIKQKQAQVASPNIVKKLEDQQKKIQEQSRAELNKNQEMAAKLDGEEFEIHASAKDGGFYSAVGAAEIMKIIKQKTGISLETNQIKIKKPIKEAGGHTILIVFKHGLEAEVCITVS